MTFHELLRLRRAVAALPPVPSSDICLGWRFEKRSPAAIAELSKKRCGFCHTEPKVAWSVAKRSVADSAPQTSPAHSADAPRRQACRS
jgi:hypothetical protein